MEIEVLNLIYTLFHIINNGIITLHNLVEIDTKSPDMKIVGSTVQAVRFRNHIDRIEEPKRYALFRIKNRRNVLH